jgi:hypothetical protein
MHILFTFLVYLAVLWCLFFTTQGLNVFGRPADSHGCSGNAGRVA